MAADESAPRTPSRLTPARVGLAVLALLLLAWGIETALAARSVSGEHRAMEEQIRESRYQAVFLDNDRVYFGHLRALGDGWFRLADAHFIREQTAQEGQEGQEQAGGQEVAPLSEELQQPEDSMLINGEHVVLVENLDRDSRVVEAIESLE